MAADNYICDKVQQAIKAFLKDDAFTAAFTAAGLSQDQIYSGIENSTAQSAEGPAVTRLLPCVECVCQDAAVDEGAEDWINWAAEAEVRVRTNADDTTETAHHALAAAVFNALTTDTIAADLSDALADFTAFKVNFTRQRWELQERSWVSIIALDVRCCGSDIS